MGKSEPKPWQFQKGQSGNPGGRPRILSEVREKAQAQAGKCIDFLVGIRDDEDQDARVRVMAAKEILDRGLGKPHQSVDVSTTEGGSIRIDLSGLKPGKARE